MSVFKLKTADDIQETADSIGSGGAIDSGIYDAFVVNAYATESSGGSAALALELNIPSVNRKIRQTIYISNKSGEIFYERNGVKKHIPGYLLAEELVMLITEGNVGIMDIDSEERHVNIYDSTEKKELPTQVPVFVSLLNQPIKVAVLKVSKPKSEKVGDTWVDTDNLIEVNEFDKFFDNDTSKSLNEMMEGADEATFINTWKDRWEGKVKTIAPKAAAGTGMRKGAATAAKATNAPKKKFFGK